MKCKHAQKMLADYVDEVLDAEDNRRVQEHIAGCDSCRRELDVLRQILGHINDVKVEYPPAHVWENFLPDLHRRIEREAILAFRRQRRQRFYALPGWVASVAAVVLIFVAAMMLQYYPNDRPAWLQTVENIEITRSRPLTLTTVKDTSEPVLIAGMISEMLITDAELAELENLKSFIQSEDLALSYQYYDDVIGYAGDLDEEPRETETEDNEGIIQFLLESGFAEFDEATIIEFDSAEFGAM